MEAFGDVIYGSIVGPIALDKHVELMLIARKTSKKLHPKALEAPFSTVFCHNFRPEADSDVISGAIVEATGMEVRVKFGGSRSNRSRDIRLSQMRDEQPRPRRQRTPVIT